MKTTFGPGVIVTSKWLNGAKKLHFDGLDQDWHYDPINRSDIQRGGEDGLDNVYVTMTTDQEYRATGGITGRKKFYEPGSVRRRAECNRTTCSSFLEHQR